MNSVRLSLTAAVNNRYRLPVPRGQPDFAALGLNRPAGRAQGGEIPIVLDYTLCFKGAVPRWINRLFAKSLSERMQLFL